MPVTIEVVGLDEVLQRLQIMQWSLAHAPRKVVQEASKILKEAMQHEAPVRTGALRRGIHYRTYGTVESAYARFYDDEDYAQFVLEGTAAHDIYPREKQALFWPGAEHPVPFVHHPGTKADPFTERAMRELERASEALLEATGEAIVQGERITA